MERLLRYLIAPSHCGPVLALLLVAYYGMVALFNPDVGSLDDRQLMLLLTAISSIGILLGWWLTPSRDRVDVVPRDDLALERWVGGTFVLFVLLTTLSAPNIPLLSAAGGESVQDIAVARENFLKAREGIFAALPYVNGMLTFSFVPYAMCLAFIVRRRIAWVFLAVFLGYSMLFVEKAFFVRVLAPLSALIVVTHNRRIRLSLLLAGATAILALNIQLSGFADADRDIAQFFVYRLLEVPAQTAIDTLAFWRETWNGDLLLGATNLFFSNVFLQERIQLERLVFEYQFGAFETGTGSSNAVYFIDAYVNFGLIGVVITSIIVGSVMKFIGRSADPALRCLAPLLVYSLFFASFFSVMFGNGLLLFLLLKPLLARRRLGVGRRRTRPVPSPEPSGASPA